MLEDLVHLDYKVSEEHLEEEEEWADEDLPGFVESRERMAKLARLDHRDCKVAQDL